MAYPTRSRVVADYLTLSRRRPPAAHYDTRGMALANVMAGAQTGVRRFDASLGGLGGCPTRRAPRATPAPRTWCAHVDLIGYDTGIDLAALVACAVRLPGSSGHVPSQLVKAGAPHETASGAGVVRRNPRAPWRAA